MQSIGPPGPDRARLIGPRRIVGNRLRDKGSQPFAATSFMTAPIRRALDRQARRQVASSFVKFCQGASSFVKDSFGRIGRYQGVAGRQGRNRRLADFCARFSRRRSSLAHGFRATDEPMTKEQITTNSDYRKENDASAAAMRNPWPAVAGLVVEAEPLRAYGYRSS
jgi:hypothetical protein